MLRGGTFSGNGPAQERVFVGKLIRVGSKSEGAFRSIGPSRGFMERLIGNESGGINVELML